MLLVWAVIALIFLQNKSVKEPQPDGQSPGSVIIGEDAFASLPTAPPTISLQNVKVLPIVQELQKMMQRSVNSMFYTRSNCWHANYDHHEFA